MEPIQHTYRVSCPDCGQAYEQTLRNGERPSGTCGACGSRKATFSAIPEQRRVTVEEVRAARELFPHLQLKTGEYLSDTCGCPLSFALLAAGLLQLPIVDEDGDAIRADEYGDEIERLANVTYGRLYTCGFVNGVDDVTAPTVHPLQDDPDFRLGLWDGAMVRAELIDQVAL